MFKKYGDSMPIIDIKDVDGETIICQKCNMPMTVVAVQEDDSFQLECTCENPDLE